MLFGSSPQDTGLEYWHKQLIFVPPDATLRRLVACVREETRGAFLRFGRADIDAALSVDRAGSETPPEIGRAVRQAFLLFDPKVLAALDVELQTPARSIPTKSKKVAEREALGQLNAVGACFLERPIYSYAAVSSHDPQHADLRAELFASLKSQHPALLFNEEDDHRGAVEAMAPSWAKGVAGADVFESLDGLEEEISKWAAMIQGFPILVVALGVPGRVLAARLIRSSFRGFILDLDHLAGIEFGPSRRPVVSAAVPKPTSRMAARTRGMVKGGQLRVRWEGPFLGDFSFSVINRELCSTLAKDGGIELSITPNDVPFMLEGIPEDSSAGFRSIVKRVRRPLSGPAHFHIQNHVHHPDDAPEEGHWIVIQPWDYMSLPVSWVDWIRTKVDQVWVPSSFVRRAYLEADIPPECVAVIPNGVDTRVYRPERRKARLNTNKRFKFLYVGGPFWRKGFDILLEAYGKAFTRGDDTCLVIKSVPEFWTSAGSQQIADLARRPEAPDTLIIVQSLPADQMAGLYAACDCLVHPYRAEGFALCVAEGMASGLPVIVTGAGGTADYCDEHSTLLIPAELRKMERRQIDDMPTLDYPTYAEPDVEALANHMRFVYENQEAAQRIARAGMEKVRSGFTWEHAAAAAVQRLMRLEGEPIRRRMVG